MTRLRADGLLFLTTIIWGVAFLAQKSGNATMGPITFVGARFLFSALMVLPLVAIEARRSTTALTRNDIGLCCLIGLLVFIGSWMQQVAMLTTTITNGGFLTALTVVLVPITTWILTRKRVTMTIVVACAVSLLGGWLLSYRGPAQAFSAGDVLLVVSDIAWAFNISLIAVFLQRTPRPFLLSFARFAVAAVLGLAIGPAFEPATYDGLKAALPAILYAGLISGGIGFTLQVVAQRYTPAPEAAVIMSFESVAAAITGALFLEERLTALSAVGCLLILFGVLIVQVGPRLWQRKPPLTGAL